MRDVERAIGAVIRLCLEGRGPEVVKALEALEALEEAAEHVEAEDAAQPALWDSGAAEA